MARVAAFVPDLLFGSNVIGSLRAEGHEAVLVSGLGDVSAAAADVLVVDLTADAPERIAQVRAAEHLDGLAKLAFYSHVEADVRAAAQEAGFELVVPRSRMAREGPALVTRLASEASPGP
jgi:hypothetical protein